MFSVHAVRFEGFPTVRTKKEWVYSIKFRIVLASGWQDDYALSIWIDEAADPTAAQHAQSQYAVYE